MPKPMPTEEFTDPMKAFRMLDRWLSKVDRVGRGPDSHEACWRWTAAFDGSGYGKFSVGGRGRQRVLGAHRVGYILLTGPIPDELALDHLCNNTWCVNPKHLEPVTTAENNRRKLIRQRASAGAASERGTA